MEIGNTNFADNKVHCASFIAAEQYIVSNGEDNKVKIWLVETGQIAHKVDQPEKVISLFVSPDSTLIYFGSETGVGTWDLKIEQEGTALTLERMFYYNPPHHVHLAAPDVLDRLARIPWPALLPTY